MNKPIHCYHFTVQETHLDVFGHMNHAVYLELFEEARWDLITVGGYGLKKILQEKIGPVVLEASIVYKKELAAREKILINTYSGEMKNKLVMTLNQEMLKENGDFAATLKLSVGLFDMQKRKLLLPTDDWLSAIGMVLPVNYTALK